MIDVFISRPTWVHEKFRKGLEGFLKFIRTLELNHRTLGFTDYPNKAPLDEVIRIMKQCFGVIILGYPQIIIKTGSIKEKEIEISTSLSTEWNHIEAGLAFAQVLPMLNIHHTDVNRGIFDRGAIPNYLYEINLEEGDWPLKNQIQGALKTWKAHVLDNQKKLSIKENSIKVNETTTTNNLPDACIIVLKIVAN